MARHRLHSGGTRNIKLDPKVVREALLNVFQDETVSDWEDGELRLDTPYILQDGHLFRIYLRPVPGNGHVLVTDDAFALQQLAIFLGGTRLHQHDSDLAGIAQQLNLKWEGGEFQFVESNLDDLVHRIALLARAVDMALSLAHAAPAVRVPIAAHLQGTGSLTARLSLRVRLGPELRELGLRVERRALLQPSNEVRPTMVDYYVRRNGSEAAVDVVAGRAEGQARSAIDRAAVDFCLLADAKYQGWMFAVYDEDSPASSDENRERFIAVAPERAELIGGREAAPAIASRLRSAN